MPTYSQGLSLLKGAIVAVDLATSRQTTFAFQYNPVTVKRSLAPHEAVKVRPLLVKPGQTGPEMFGTRRGESL